MYNSCRIPAFQRGGPRLLYDVVGRVKDFFSGIILRTAPSKFSKWLLKKFVKEKA
jgi:hypothetical protein